MRGFAKGAGIVLAGVMALGLGAPLAAQPIEDTLIVNEELEMTTRIPAPEYMAEIFDEVISGWHFRTGETRDMQRDDFDNPGMLFAEQGRDAWNTVEGDAGHSCASCHEGPESLAGYWTQNPRIGGDSNGELWAAEQYINNCRETRMEAEPWGWDSNQMKNMTALIASQSRGMPMNITTDGEYAEHWELGKEIYYTRYGQMQLACANCHEENNGQMIRADHLSQGHINGFPTYRLRTAGLVSRHNRFRGCIRDTRGVPYGIGSPEFVALELYLASRGNGLSVEGPAVRN